MQIVALHSLDCRACMLLDALHLNRWRGHARKLWERFGIVRLTRGVDILSRLVVGMCLRDLARDNHLESLLFARATCWWNWRGMRSWSDRNAVCSGLVQRCRLTSWLCAHLIPCICNAQLEFTRSYRELPFGGFLRFQDAPLTIPVGCWVCIRRREAGPGRAMGKGSTRGVAWVRGAPQA